MSSPAITTTRAAAAAAPARPMRHQAGLGKQTMAAAQSNKQNNNQLLERATNYFRITWLMSRRQSLSIGFGAGKINSFAADQKSFQIKSFIYYERAAY